MRFHGMLPPPDLRRSADEQTLVQTKRQLTEYFQGTRKTFDLPLVMDGTDFQVQAWNQLLKIPYGTTISYAEQAERIGDKKKARAVGMANGRNPIAIVIPCHRVIGSNGHLAGFAGGLEKKDYLLRWELFISCSQDVGGLSTSGFVVDKRPFLNRLSTRYEPFFPSPKRLESINISTGIEEEDLSIYK